MRIRLLNKLSKYLAGMAERLDEMARLLRRCPDCGRNPLTGSPCKNG